ncbi:helix-turn-helix domain-containing protein [Labrys okinawensis]|uniref:helix-turn-helix domain-containing protein n=1 Tax=Labrys okinawensis TaxID=346911 RepID=UPI003D155490
MRNVSTVIEVDWDRFCEDLKEARAKMNISVREMAKIAGVNFNIISRLEHKKIHCGTEAFFRLSLLIGKPPMEYIVEDKK